MKRFFITMLCLFLACNNAFCFSIFKKNQKPAPAQTEETTGYEGELPDIEEPFKDLKKEPEVPVGIFNSDTELEKKSLEKIPLDNSKFVEVIIKKSTLSPFATDIRDIISILEKLQKTLNNDFNIQIYNAQVANLINHVNYFRTQYQENNKYSVSGYWELVDFCNMAREIAVENSQRILTEKYIPIGSESEKKLNIQLNELSSKISDIIYLLEEVRNK